MVVSSAGESGRRAVRVRLDVAVVRLARGNARRRAELLTARG